MIATVDMTCPGCGGALRLALPGTSGQCFGRAAACARCATVFIATASGTARLPTDTERAVIEASNLGPSLREDIQRLRVLHSGRQLPLKQVHVRGEEPTFE